MAFISSLFTAFSSLRGAQRPSVHPVNVLDWQYYHNAVRDWLTALAILVAVTLALTATRQVTLRRLRQDAGRVRGHQLSTDLIGAEFVRRTSVLFLLVLGIAAASLGLTLPLRVEAFIRGFTIVALLLQLGLWADGLVKVLLTRYVARQTAATDGEGGGIAASRTTVAALGIFIRAVLWIVLLLVGLDSLGVRVTTLITGLGVTGIALALAVQNILGDLFAALSIVVDKPFLDGDPITVDGFSGTVEHIGLKTTRVRAYTGEQIVFSNADLLKSRIRNFKSLQRRTSTLIVTLDQSAPAAAIARVPSLLRSVIEALPQVRFDRSHITTPTANGISVETVFTVLSADYTTFMNTQQAITIALLERLPALGVALATGGVTVVMDDHRADTTSPRPAGVGGYRPGTRTSPEGQGG
jgi:small-conductance mechanosensitive channel